MAENKKQYILYGASFDPPHMGHFSAIRQLLEEYDKVVVFPYPHKHDNGQLEKILPIKKRLKMLEIFIAEFFPQISERLLLVNLSEELKQKDKKTDGFLHTYDYLKFIQTKIDTQTTDLSVCLGIDAQNNIEKNSFYKEAEIVKEFGVFRLMEEKQIKSGDIRKFLQSKKVIKSKKDEIAIVQYLGYHVSQYVIEHNLYGLVNKKNDYTNKVNPAAPTVQNMTSTTENYENLKSELTNSDVLQTNNMNSMTLPQVPQDGLVQLEEANILNKSPLTPAISKNSHKKMKK